MRQILTALTLSLAMGLAPAAIAQDDVDEPTRMERLLEVEPALLAALQTRDPAKHEDLMRLKRLDRRAYYKALGRLARHVHEHRPDPETEALMARLAALKARHPQGTDALSRAERKAFEAEVTEVAEALFDRKQAKRREKIEQLKQALSELEAEVEARDKDRSARIQAFVARVLDGPADL